MTQTTTEPIAREQIIETISWLKSRLEKILSCKNDRDKYIEAHKLTISLLEKELENV